MLITDTAIRNRTTVAVLGLIIILLGGYSYLSLPREAFPDIPIPHILVTTMYEGVSPEDVETSVTMKIEKELSGIRGVKEVRSSSAEGLSLITVEFLPDIQIEDALQRRNFRAVDDYHGKCHACQYRKVCGGCRARADAVYGDVLGDDPICPYDPKG